MNGKGERQSSSQVLSLADWGVRRGSRVHRLNRHPSEHFSGPSSESQLTSTDLDLTEWAYPNLNACWILSNQQVRPWRARKDARRGGPGLGVRGLTRPGSTGIPRERRPFWAAPRGAVAGMAGPGPAAPPQTGPLETLYPSLSRRTWGQQGTSWEA